MEAYLLPEGRCLPIVDNSLMAANLMEAAYCRGGLPMSVCPVCNGLHTVTKDCPRCGRQMYDAGLLQDYYDCYSAFLEQSLYEDGYRAYSHDYCVHLFACPHCHYDTDLRFRRLEQDELPGG